MAVHSLINGAGRGPRVGELGVGVATDKVYTDWQTGPLAQTGNPLDASLGDNLFFAVRAPGGERYTRAGNFHLDGSGRLRNAAGLPVLNANGQPIVTTPGQRHFALDGAGNLTADGRPIARLRIVQANPAMLIKAGDSLFTAANPQAVRLAANPVVHPGMLEQSNANAVTDLVRLITVSRGFEMAQRAVTTQDELLRLAATEVGKA